MRKEEERMELSKKAILDTRFTTVKRKYYLAEEVDQFLDALALVLLTIPIFYPVVVGLGFDPIWFGVMIVLVTQMGVISPPVGVNVYVVGGMDRAVSLQSVFKGALPFLGALVVAALLMLYFPQLVLVPASWGK